VATKKLKLITAGCSFSEIRRDYPETWPVWVERKYGLSAVHTGKSCQGNGMISRSVLYQIDLQLKTHSPDNLLVGIMWSGPTRHEQYVNERANFSSNVDGWIDNPVTFIEDDPGSWIIYNANWQIPQAKKYYRNMFDTIYSQIQTLEHILRVQDYLELHNIKYFMGTYTDDVFKVRDHPNLDWMYNRINFDKFLPIEGCWDWVRDNSKFPMPPKNGNHPSSKQHEEFTHHVIVPFLKEKYNIDDIR